jgi:hypothetical protein
MNNVIDLEKMRVRWRGQGQVHLTRTVRREPPGGVEPRQLGKIAQEIIMNLQRPAR